VLDLTEATSLLRLLSDSTRVRLLALLRREELTVAEISSVLGLAQPRVSTHLAKLKEIRDRAGAVLDNHKRAYKTGKVHDLDALGKMQTISAELGELETQFEVAVKKAAEQLRGAG